MERAARPRTESDLTASPEVPDPFWRRVTASPRGSTTFPPAPMQSVLRTSKHASQSVSSGQNGSTAAAGRCVLGAAGANGINLRRPST